MKPQTDEDIPYIYAKKKLTHVSTYDTYEKRFEGLVKGMSNGKTSFNVIKEYSVRVSGKDGSCKIPATPNNRKLFKELSSPRELFVTKHVEEDGQLVERKVSYMEPPIWTRMDKSVLEKNTQAALVKEVIRQLKESGETIPMADETSIPMVENEGALEIDMEAPLDDDLFELDVPKSSGGKTLEQIKKEAAIDAQIETDIAAQKKESNASKGANKFNKK